MHHLDRHFAVEADVIREVDHSHAATRDPGQDRVAVLEGLPDKRVRGMGGHRQSLWNIPAFFGMRAVGLARCVKESRVAKLYV